MKKLEDWKIKISVLWIVIGILGVLIPFSELYLPGNMEEIISGGIEGTPITPELMLGFAVFTLIPLVMAVLSLTLKDKVNRWINIIIGIIIAFVGLANPIMFVTEKSPYLAYMILFGMVMILFASLIVWYAWKSKQKA